MEHVARKQAAIRGITEEEVRSELTRTSPLGRMVEAGDVAAACLFLASHGSAAITGEDLNVTTGTVMY
jgi:enoyl-[acyl-carrier-protein] reductase (NADH)